MDRSAYQMGTLDDDDGRQYWRAKTPQGRMEALELIRQIVYGYDPATTRDFKEFLRLLTSNDVKYLVTDGYAVNYYGFSRATADLDIWVDRSPENAEATFQEPGKVIRMGVPPLRLEILTSISGVEFPDC